MNDRPTPEFTLQCPTPLGLHTTVQAAHGGGGRLMKALIENLFLPRFAGGAEVQPPHDGVVLTVGDSRIAFTTDSFVVHPIFFPGGDIGKLAVCGTVNDLAMCGAKPQWLSAGFILEEGFPLESLQRIVDSMQRTAVEAGVTIVTGDTKVVGRGKGDGIFINTAGIGLVPPGLCVGPAHVKPGDAILLSGDIGRHGIAIMSVREGLAFEGALESDCAPLADAVESLAGLGPDLHCLRDLTRGGLAAALNEIAMDVGVGILIEETAVPVMPAVAGACELLGLDPLYAANEGRFIAVVPEASADEALHRLRSRPTSAGAVRIGVVRTEYPGTVELRSPFGRDRIVDLPAGEPMPRIC